MTRVAEPDADLQWLSVCPEDEAWTGYSPELWEAEAWVLHAIYELAVPPFDGTHDEMGRRAIAGGLLEPTIVGDVNLDEETTDTGIPLGYVRRPGPEWRRLTWQEYLDRTNAPPPAPNIAPCFRWFADASFPASVQPPPEGSLDAESLAALLEVLAAHTHGGDDAPCVVLYAVLAGTNPRADVPELWSGPLAEVPTLIRDHGGPYYFSPSNLWPADKSWFLYTDYDPQSTRISGTAALINALRTADALETIDWAPSAP